MHVIKLLKLFVVMIILFRGTAAFSQSYVKFYCYSNSQLYVLPQNTASGCDNARCMFENYFKAVGKHIDNNIVYCSPVVLNSNFTIIDFPSCPVAIPNGAQVIIYRDENYNTEHGEYIAINPGTEEARMDNTERNTSFFQFLGFGHGNAVRDNEVTSLKVPNGLKITCYEHPDFKGDSISFTSDCPNVGAAWNDKISSYIVQAVSQQTSTRTHRIDNLSATTAGHQTDHIDVIGSPIQNLSTVPNIYTIPDLLTKTFKMQNVWRHGFINTEHEVNCNSILPGWISAQWVFESAGSNTYKIKNQWTQGYLATDDLDHIFCVTNIDSSLKARWQIELMPGINTVRLKNAFSGKYLNVEAGPLRCSSILPGWLSANWEFRSL